jgi:ribosome-associated protein
MIEEYDYEYAYDENGEIEYYAVRPNKTQLKKDIAALFALAEKMSKLTETQLNTLGLPENIHKAVIEASGMPHKGARKRLLKYIAGQLHKIDVEPILEKMARIENKSAHATREHHILERWRDRLIAEGDDALSELLDECPEADRQQLRQLLRQAQKEVELAKPPKTSRLIYRYLKELFEFDGAEQEDIVEGIQDEEDE